MNILILGKTQTLTIIEDGAWVNGTWIEGPQGGQVKGTVMNLKPKEIENIEPGKYSKEDRKFYTKDTVTDGQKVTWKGNTYEANSFRDYEDADLKIYILKRVKVSE